MGRAKGDGRGRARLGDETWRSGRGGEAGDDRKRPIFDLTERSRPWLETFPQRAFRRPHPRSLLKSSGGLHRFAIGHGLGRRKERGREPRVSRGRGWRYTKKRWAEWHGKLFLKSRDPSLPRHLSSRSSSRDARSGINNLTPCRTDKPAPLPAVQQRGKGTSRSLGRSKGRRREKEVEKTARNPRNSVRIVSHARRRIAAISCGHRGSTRVSYVCSFTYSQ